MNGDDRSFLLKNPRKIPEFKKDPRNSDENKNIENIRKTA
jgi:hypothetical protein